MINCFHPAIFTSVNDKKSKEDEQTLEELNSAHRRSQAKCQFIHRMQIWRTTRLSPGTSHESEASEASVFCFDNASPEKSCFVDGLVCFISLCLLVFVFLNASRRDRNCPTFASTGKQWIHGIR